MTIVRGLGLEMFVESLRMNIKRIDHIAIVVEDIPQALGFWRDALGLDVSRVEDVPAQKALVAFLPAGGSQVELVKPTEGGTGMARFLEKRGPGMHHICFEVDDLDTCLAQLKEKEIRLINEQPTTGAGGKRIAFIHPESTTGVLVELYESPRVAAGSPQASLVGKIISEGWVFLSAARAFWRTYRQHGGTNGDSTPVVLEERGNNG